MKKIEKIKKEHHKLARAIHFLVNKILDRTGKQKPSVRTDKPLVIHSLETAFYLKNFGYSNEIVIAGLLHDLFEDTDTKKSEVEKNFGKKIADIVEMVSYDFNIKKGTDYKKNYDKMSNFKEALIVKAGDIIENLKYFEFAPKKEIPKVLDKWNYFLEVAKLIKGEIVYKELNQKLRQLSGKAPHKKIIKK